MSSAPIIASSAELVPANCFEPFDFGVIYGRDAPVEVDLGCGDGSFLVAMAAENPGTDFLGIDRLHGRVNSACRKIERAGLTNARVARFELFYAVEQLLPLGCISTFYLLFPDPWPKRRHAARRIVNANFLASLHRALVPGGTVHVATDEAEYFRQITRLVSASPDFVVVPNSKSQSLLPVSKFESEYRKRGLSIHRLELRKVSPAT